MPKKDPIFWGAAALFLLSFVTSFATQNDLWLFLMVASYLLRPTLASLGLARRLVDERMMSIQYRSGNIAFAVMLGAAVFFAVFLRIKNDHSWEMFNVIIVLGLASKALFNVLLQKNYREAGCESSWPSGSWSHSSWPPRTAPPLRDLWNRSPGLGSSVLAGWPGNFPEQSAPLFLSSTRRCCSSFSARDSLGDNSQQPSWFAYRCCSRARACLPAKNQIQNWYPIFPHNGLVDPGVLIAGLVWIGRCLR